MQNILTIILAMAMMLSTSLVFAQETGVAATTSIMEKPVDNVIYIKGEIKEINEGRVRVVGQGVFKEVVLNIQNSTYILNAQDGTKISFKDLKEGDAITAYYGPALTKSLPPQGNANALIVGTPEKGSTGMYMKVGKLQENNDGSIKVLSTNADRLVTIAPTVYPALADINDGSELMVWYDVMTMSMPGQATAKKVVLLSEKDTIKVHPLAGTLVVNGKELTLGENDIIKTRVMVPLRVIAESLGYNIVWSDNNSTIGLEKGARTVSLTIGSKYYGKSKTTVQLDCAPELVNGITLVPIEFFTDIMNVKAEVNNSHI